MARRQAPTKPEDLIKKLEEKISEFRDEILAKLCENERVVENTKADMSEAKQTSEKENDKLRDEIEKIESGFASEMEKEAKKSDEMLRNLRDQISNLIEEKVGGLKWELTAKLNSISEVVEFQDKSSSRIVKQLEEQIEWKMRDIHNNLEKEMIAMSRKVQLESTCNNDTKEQIGCLAALIDQINEKLYDFEASKRNNLIFYGIAGDTTETPLTLQAKVSRFLMQRKIKRKDNSRILYRCRQS